MSSRGRSEPEFLNRVDETIVFHALTKEHIRAIVTLMINEVNDRLKENNISIEVTDSAKYLLAKDGFDPMYGARPLRRVVQRKIEDRLSEELLKGNISRTDVILVDVSEGELKFSKKELSVTNR